MKKFHYDFGICDPLYTMYLKSYMCECMAWKMLQIQYIIKYNILKSTLIKQNLKMT